MIRLSNKTISNTIAYLNDMYPSEQEVIIHICEGYDCVEINGQVGFGVSHVPDSENEQFEIWIAGDMPDDLLITTIAHEFKHFLQYCNSQEFDEDEAEKFANKIFQELSVRKDYACKQ